MEITEYRDLKAVAESRWNRSYFTMRRQIKIAVILVVWMAIVFAIDEIFGGWSVAALLLPAMLGIPLSKKREKQIRRMVNSYQQGIE